MPEFLIGKVVSGFGEGQHFLSLHEYRQEVREHLGFSPFPGTLNLEVDEALLREFLSESKPIRIDGFERHGQSFSAITVYRVWISSFNSAIVVPDKRRHPANIVEIISEINLRKKLRLDNGDELAAQRWGE